MTHSLRRAAAVCLALLLVALAWTAWAQQSPPPAAPGQPARPDSKSQQRRPAGRRPAAASANPSAAPAPAPQGPATATGTPAAPGQAAPDLGRIEQILEGDEDVLAGNGFTYDPGNRRDPFKSLLAAQDRPEYGGRRPEGVPGLLIDEIDLKGIFRTAKGYVAQVSSANQKKSFLLKEGDQLYDGDVVRIGRNEVAFKQIVQDPTALKPFREVVKSLNPQ